MSYLISRHCARARILMAVFKCQLLSFLMWTFEYVRALQFNNYCKRIIFAQDIFSRISRRVLGARKYDVSEKINHYRASRNNCYMRENMSTRKCRLGPDARKFGSAKISTFTVNIVLELYHWCVV